MKRLLLLLLAAAALPAGAGAQRIRHPQPRHTIPTFSEAETASFVAYHQGEQRRRMAARRNSTAAARAVVAAGATCAKAITAVTRAAVPFALGDPAAPPAVIRGRVLAATHGQAVYNVLVSVEDAGISTRTGMDGEYRLSVPAERLGGPVSVSMSVLGYATARRALTLAPGDSARAVFCLTLRIIPTRFPPSRRSRSPGGCATPSPTRTPREWTRARS